MNVLNFVEQMKNIHNCLLEYLDYEGIVEEYFGNLQDFIEQNIKENKYKLKLLLHLILQIGNNHHRESNFFPKIEKILLYLKDDIVKYFTSIELFIIFQSNKRILLFFIEKKLIILDKNIINKIFKTKEYVKYFLAELQPLINESWFCSLKSVQPFIDEIKQKLPDDFYECRQNGENSEEICKLIRNDSIKEFIVYINKNNISLKNNINPSIYETNSFLNKRESTSLIEYAAFFGSIQIFNYLITNNAEIKPSMWLYAIHGKNAEIIHHLEENHIEPENKKYTECINESIKCHHNDIFIYFQNNLKKKLPKKQDIFIQSLKNYNFVIMENKFINQSSSFIYLCKYDYYFIVEFFLKEKKINVNKKVEDNDIFIIIFLNGV